MLLFLGKQVSHYLRNKSWDTRAAAHVIGAIAQNVKSTSVNELSVCVETKMSESGISGGIEDLVAWPYSQSKIVSSSLFRRLLIFCIITSFSKLVCLYACISIFCYFDDA